MTEILLLVYSPSCPWSRKMLTAFEILFAQVPHARFRTRIINIEDVPEFAAIGRYPAMIVVSGRAGKVANVWFGFSEKSVKRVADFMIKT